MRGIYDNMKTAVETIFIGKERLYNCRFIQMCSHVARQSGWESSDNQDGHFGGRGEVMIVAARR